MKAVVCADRENKFSEHDREFEGAWGRGEGPGQWGLADVGAKGGARARERRPVRLRDIRQTGRYRRAYGAAIDKLLPPMPYFLCSQPRPRASQPSLPRPP